MNLQTEQNRIEKTQKILEVIEWAYKRIQLRNNSINGFPGTFPELRKKYIQQNETTYKAIQRLENYYQKTLIS